MNQNRIYAQINGADVDVTTVFDKTVEYTPSAELINNVEEQMETIIDKYLPDILSNKEGIHDMVGEDGLFWKNKGWFISAMKKHPQYNGNLQIVLPKTPMCRHININDIKDFLTWAKDNMMEYVHYYLNGEKITKDEGLKILHDLQNIRSKAREIYITAPCGSIKEVKAETLRNKANEKIYKIRDNKVCDYQKEVDALEAIENWILNNKPDVQFSDEVIAKEVNDIFGEVRFCVGGQKMTRIIQKICKRTPITKIVDIQNVTYHDHNGVLCEKTVDMGWNHQYSKLGDAINPIELTRTAVISVNPTDFLTMSLGTNWASCMTIDKRNIRNLANNYHGMYFGGTESYMLDTSTVIFYYLEDGCTGTHPEYEYKLKRCLFYLGEDKLIQSRVYPDGRDGGEESLAGDIRKIMQKIIADLFDVPNYWSNKGGTSACGEVTSSKGVHYKDYLCYEDCNVSYMKRIDGYKNMRMVPIGRNPICPECGEEHTNEENIFCHSCESGKYTCAECGCSITEEEAFECEGEYYCCDCVEQCDHCGDYVPRREMEGETADGNYICDYCRRNYYTFSDYDNVYVNDNEVIWTEEGNCYYEDSDGYMCCDDCGDCHDADCMHYDNETGEWYCDDCYDRLMAERVAEETEDDEEVIA